MRTSLRKRCRTPWLQFESSPKCSARGFRPSAVVAKVRTKSSDKNVTAMVLIKLTVSIIVYISVMVIVLLPHFLRKLHLAAVW